MARSTAFWGALLLSVAAPILYAVAHAAPKPAPEDQAAATFWKGKTAYEQGNFAEARECFLRAYDSSKDPELLFNIAQTYRREQNCGEALFHYQRFLELAPHSTMAASAGRHVRALTDSCPVPTEAHPVVNPTVQPVAAPAATTPSPLDLSPQFPPASPAAPTAAQPQTQATVAASRANLRVWAWASLAAGVALGAATAGAAIWNDRRYQTWVEQDRRLAGGPTSGETQDAWAAKQTDNNNLLQDLKGWDRRELWSGLGAGAVLTASAVLFLIDWRRDTVDGHERTKTLSFHPVVGERGQFGFTLGWAM